jgi:hypothetical protein
MSLRPGMGLMAVLVLSSCASRNPSAPTPSAPTTSTRPASVEALHDGRVEIHAFVGRSGEPEAMQRYGFSGVPTAVLVDETGTILEVGNPLRHDALVPTLERVLAERSADARRR